MRYRTLLLVTLLGLISLPAAAQLGERPGGSHDDPVDVPRDLSGLSLKMPRIRVVHTEDASVVGGSRYLQDIDPWLGYQWGRSLTQREFTRRHGVFGETGKHAGPTLTDGATRMTARDHVSSCGMCHNTSYRDAGAGATIPKNGGTGRNTPHLFGAGLLEMLGQEITLAATRLADADGDGWIGLEEARGKSCLISTEKEGPTLDFGAFHDANGDGRPDLDPVFHILYVDAEGRRIPTATSLRGEGVAGFRLQHQVFGFGHVVIPRNSPVPPTLRAFSAVAFDQHLGLQPHDPTRLVDPDGDGATRRSNAGALQSVLNPDRDRGRVRGPTGISLDDPDRDGYCEEITEGELDLVEWYLLNHPAPGRGRITERVRRGEQLFRTIGCTTCHVPDWRLPPDEHSPGDRRFFHLEAEWNEKTSRIEGRLERIVRRDGDRSRRPPLTVTGVYSDFRHHDLGPGFQELQFDGSILRTWRTTPLWGVGSTAPYGHDGASLTLDEVILRHGGTALGAREAYAKLAIKDRDAFLAFLRSLVLYSTDLIPCDVDGDGVVSEAFRVAEQNTGIERCNPEWLFRIPGRIEGEIMNLQGLSIRSFALLNRDRAYGLELPALLDRDRDGFPDVIDPAPEVPGVRDGVR